MLKSFNIFLCLFTIIFIIFIVFEGINQDRNKKLLKAEYNKQHFHTDITYDIEQKEIDGCEYLILTYNAHKSIAHSGNCKNH